MQAIYQRLDLVWYLIKGSLERYSCDLLTYKNLFRFFDTDTSDTYLNEIEPSPKMARTFRLMNVSVVYPDTKMLQPSVDGQNPNQAP